MPPRIDAARTSLASASASRCLLCNVRSSTLQSNAPGGPRVSLLLTHPHPLGNLLRDRYLHVRISRTTHHAANSSSPHAYASRTPRSELLFAMHASFTTHRAAANYYAPCAYTSAVHIWACTSLAHIWAYTSLVHIWVYISLVHIWAYTSLVHIWTLRAQSNMCSSALCVAVVRLPVTCNAGCWELVARLIGVLK